MDLIRSLVTTTICGETVGIIKDNIVKTYELSSNEWNNKIFCIDENGEVRTYSNTY